MSKVVHCKKSRYDVYSFVTLCVEFSSYFTKYFQLVGRPGKWGNPFKISDTMSREEVIKKYEEYLLNTPSLMNDLHELKGKVLGCWYAPLPCHGDVLSKYANQVISPPQQQINSSSTEQKSNLTSTFKSSPQTSSTKTNSNSTNNK